MSDNAVRAKLDIVFKKLMTENSDLLQDFLASVLKIPYDSIKNISILNSEILPETITGKFSRLDLKMEVDGSLINAEIQIRETAEYKDRALFYWTKLYSGDLKSGEDYIDIKKSISINIVNFNLFGCREFHSEFTVMETGRHEVLTDKCAIHFFELKKISRKVNKDDKTELWLQLINAETKEEFDMLEQTGVAPIQRAVFVLHQMSEDEKTQELARMREKALHDETTELNHAKREGEKKGLEKGLEKGRQEGLEKAKEKMRSSGMTEDEINRILGA
jgi:predicted transposase/invertase (TIGR01784 family)